MPITVIMILTMIDLFNSNTSKKNQLKKACKNYFGVDLNIQNIILYNAPTDDDSYTTVFKDDRSTIYALCLSDKPITLTNVKNIIRSMGMKADKYLPPNADNDYFLHFGQKLFQSVFPSLKLINDDETLYYQTLAPYSPALVKINKVNGEIRQYDKIWQKWQRALKLSYTRMQIL